ncbi:hypothetical protein ACLTEW_23410 [Gordonia lacunae]|uniref:hypothetical protein n=1 Tax=Gordonia lacunae TaxID=417102 RepID=UPI0039E729EF
MLTPFDDYPIHQTSEPLAHAGQGHPDQYDRFWFNGYTEDFFFAVALGVYPNRGVIDAAFSVVHDGVQRSVYASGRIPLDRTATQIGPIGVKILEPMRTCQITVDAPEHGLTATLTSQARTSVVEEERGVLNVGTRRTWDLTRATQLVSWTGSLTTGGTKIDLTGKKVYGTKDRSWGVRPVGIPPQRAPEDQDQQLFFLWTPLNFEDKCLHYMVHEDSHGVPWAETGAIIPVIGEQDPVFDVEDTVLGLGTVRHEIDWEPGLRRARSGKLLFSDPDGQDVSVELEPLFPFRMRGVGYFHPKWQHGTWHDELVVGGEEFTVEELDVLQQDYVHLQQVVRAKWGDRTGYGVMEQVVFGPYYPAGMTDFLDGAQQDVVSLSVR